MVEGESSHTFLCGFLSVPKRGFVEKGDFEGFEFAGAMKKRETLDKMGDTGGKSSPPLQVKASGLEQISFRLL